MGFLFESEAESVDDPGAVASFNLAKPYYQQGLGNLGALANQVKANPAYAGQRVAAMNPFQSMGANSLGGFAGDTSGFAQNFMNSGMGNLASGAGVGQNYQNMYNQFSGDPTQQILDSANQYANNPYVTGMIDAANRDTMRGLTEQQLPSMARAFSGTGNTNSSRAGVEQAIAERGAADRMADTASNMRGQFFGQGLGMAQNQYNQNLTNMMNANSGLMSAGQFGAGLMGAGQDFAQNNFGQFQNAGGMFQTQNQAELDAQKSYFDESLANQMGVNSALVGNAAQTKTQTSAGVNQQPSIMSQIASVGQAAAAGYGAYTGKSDVRAKENIVRVGELPSGLPVYTFEYKDEFKDKDGHGRFIGVMAQEAKEMFPDAVMVADDGYYAVDYSRIN